MLRRLCLSLIILFGFSSMASAGPIDYDRLDERFQKVAAKPEIVGLAVAIVENGELSFAEG